MQTENVDTQQQVYSQHFNITLNFDFVYVQFA